MLHFLIAYSLTLLPYYALKGNLWSRYQKRVLEISWKQLWNTLSQNQQQNVWESRLPVLSLFLCAPIFGFSTYLFLESLLSPLQPALENLWFVGFWWPLATIVALFLTPPLALIPIRKRLMSSNSFKTFKDDFYILFPILSFLCIFGSFLHLLGDQILYEGVLFSWKYILSIWFVLLLPLFVQNRSTEAQITLNTSLLLGFSFLYLSAPSEPFFILFGLLMGLGLLFLQHWFERRENEFQRVLDLTSAADWTPLAWKDVRIPIWEESLHTHKEKILSSILDPNDSRTTFLLPHNPHCPSSLYLEQLKHRFNREHFTTLRKGPMHKKGDYKSLEVIFPASLITKSFSFLQEDESAEELNTDFFEQTQKEFNDAREKDTPLLLFIDRYDTLLYAIYISVYTLQIS